MDEQHWRDTTLHSFGMLLDGRAPTTGRRQPGKDVTVLVLINGHHEPVQFTLPTCVGASAWSLLLDTNLPESLHGETFKTGAQYLLTDRSLVLFVLDAKHPADEGSPHAGSSLIKLLKTKIGGIAHAYHETKTLPGCDCKSQG